jgi:hypothetical protein
MTDVTELPIKGYTSQPADKIARVNHHKELEEQILRVMDAMVKPVPYFDENGVGVPCDPRWVAVARTHIEQGFMALNRAVLQPQRVSMPYDKHPDA